MKELRILKTWSFWVVSSQSQFFYFVSFWEHGKKSFFGHNVQKCGCQKRQKSHLASAKNAAVKLQIKAYEKKIKKLIFYVG